MEKVYKVTVNQGFSTSITLTPINAKGEETKPLLVIEEEAIQPNRIPHVIVSELKKRGERFVGSLPDRDRSYFVITEPIAQAAKPTSDSPSPYDPANAQKFAFKK